MKAEPQSSPEPSEEHKHEPEEEKPRSIESLTNNNGAQCKEEEEEVGGEVPDHPQPSFKYSHSRLPRAETPASVAFPTARVRRLIRSEGDIRTNPDAIFLINKAVERFLEQFVEDSFEYVLKENKNTLSYKSLSSNVSNQKRYEFLADFVPEKVKASDALSEKASAEG